jgi:hypothetical protein
MGQKSSTNDATQKDVATLLKREVFVLDTGLFVIERSVLLQIVRILLNLEEFVVSMVLSDQNGRSAVSRGVLRLLKMELFALGMVRRRNLVA